MIFKGLSLLFLSCLLMVGCSPRHSESTPQVLEEDLVEEEIEVMEVDTAEEVKERLLVIIREEMRIFDVVAHHDALHEAITHQMVGQNRNALEAIASEVVQKHMDAHLRNRIEILLEMENEYYVASDVEWIFNRVSTRDLYTLMTLYEKTFYEKTQGWKD